MSLLDELPRLILKKEPSVWVERLVLYSRLSPRPEVIREVKLHRGLNVVWAEEPESTADQGNIAGHSAGKTTFCRLLRYVLAEKTYGRKSGMQAIRATFPNGYVGAELHVGGVKWAVLRPLGENRHSRILREGTIEALLEDKGEPAYLDTYAHQIGLTALLHGLASATVVRTEEEIKWGHVLAWCSRDQEARFQNIHEWRSPRSESDWPAFRFPKADPLFVMRILLGLFLPEELGTEELLAASQRRLEDAENELERVKREPEYWRRHFHDKVRAQLTERLPLEAADIARAPVSSDELAPDLRRFVAKASYQLQEQIDASAPADDRLQKDLNDCHERLAQARRELEQLEALYQLGTKAAAEIQAGLAQESERHRKANELRDRPCPFGDIRIGDCSYVRERQRRLAPGDLQRAHSLEQIEAERTEEQEKFARQQEALRQRITEEEGRRDDLLTQQRRHAEARRALSDSIRSLANDLRELLVWDERVNAPDKTERLREVALRITQLKADIEADREKLNRLLAQHDEHRDLLHRLFSLAAREVLPPANYDGVVSFDNREINFQIRHGGTMNGEAIETLAVLLADITCLVFTFITRESHLPGVLIHDSPREADLGLRLYHNFIRFVAHLETLCGGPNSCPFQYILTTTTPPPPDAAQAPQLILRLDASQEDTLLFRRDLSRPPPESELHLPLS